MPTKHFLCQHTKIDPLNPACCSLKAKFDNLVLQSYGLKNLRTFVRMKCRYTHLGHDLEHSLGHALAIGGYKRSVIAKFLGIA